MIIFWINWIKENILLTQGGLGVMGVQMAFKGTSMVKSPGRCIINKNNAHNGLCKTTEMGAFKLNMCHFGDGSPCCNRGQEGVEIWMVFSWIRIFLGYSHVLTIVRGKSFAKLSRKCSLSCKRKLCLLVSSGKIVYIKEKQEG